MKGLRNLKVWHEAHELAVMVYEITNNFPKEEMFGLISQLKRAVSSIAANIAEGEGRFYKKEGVRFLYIARGSLFETDSFISLAKDLGYIEHKEIEMINEKIEIVGKLLNGLINSVQNNTKSKALGARS